MYTSVSQIYLVPLRLAHCNDSYKTNSEDTHKHSQLLIKTPINTQNLHHSHILSRQIAFNKVRFHTLYALPKQLIFFCRFVLFLSFVPYLSSTVREGSGGGEWRRRIQKNSWFFVFKTKRPTLDYVSKTLII